MKGYLDPTRSLPESSGNSPPAELSPLAQAARKGDLAAITGLIASAADIDDGGESPSPLYESLTSSSAPASRLLLEAGARCDRQGLYPALINLGIAIGDPDLVRMLIKGGCQIRDLPESEHPLATALFYHESDIFSDLIAGGVESDIMIEGLPILLHVVNHQLTSLIQPILDAGADIHISDSGGNTSLHFAANHRDPQVITILVENSSDPRRQNIGGNTPLMIACREPTFAPPPQLYEGDGIIDMRNCYNETALHIAVKSANLAAVSTLLSHGAQQSPDITGTTPLHLACKGEGGFSLVQKLLSQRPNLSPDQVGRSPMHIAAASGALSSLWAIADAGCQWDIDDGARTPLDAAGENGGASQERIEQIATWYPEEQRQVMIGFALADEDRVLRNITPTLIETRWESGQTLLHKAASRGMGEVMVYLLSQGSDINARDDDGDTPLHLAIRRENPEAQEILISSQARVDIANAKGITAGLEKVMIDRPSLT
jgi:ankyrin repeat protein